MSISRQTPLEDNEQEKTLDAVEDFLGFVNKTGAKDLFATGAGHAIQVDRTGHIIRVSWTDPAQGMIALTVDTSSCDVELLTASCEPRIRSCAYLTIRLILSRAIQVIERYEVESRRSADIPSALSLLDAQLAKVGCDSASSVSRPKANDVRLVYRAMDELCDTTMLQLGTCRVARDETTSAVGITWTGQNATTVGVLFDIKTGKPVVSHKVPPELVPEVRRRGVQCITEMAQSLRLFMPLYQENVTLFCEDVQHLLEATRPE